MTGNGIFAFFDAPLDPDLHGGAVLPAPHAGLGGDCLCPACSGTLAWLGHRQTVAPAEAGSQGPELRSTGLPAAQAAQRRGGRVNGHGGTDCAPIGSSATREPMALQLASQGNTHRITAWSKFFATPAIVCPGRWRPAGDRWPVELRCYDCRQCADDPGAGAHRHDGRHLARFHRRPFGPLSAWSSLLKELPASATRPCPVSRPRGVDRLRHVVASAPGAAPVHPCRM